MTPIECDIAIVGSGAIIPGARGGDQFFHNLMEGRSYVHDLRDIRDLTHRPLYDLVYSSDRTVSDSSYSTMGAVIDRHELVALAAKHKLELADHLWQHILAIDVVDQALSGLDLDKSARANCDFIFGSPDAVGNGYGAYLPEQHAKILSETDDPVLREQFANVFRREVQRNEPIRPKILAVPSQLSEKVQSRFGLGGASFLLDAACASTFAAISFAVRRLRQGLCRFAVVGGVDDSLGASNMIIAFSKFGVLSEKGPLPFDSRSDGTVLGDGAAAFLLTTVHEAEKRGWPVLGVIKSIGGSSDGRAGGLTEPTVPGQLGCYHNTYGDRCPEKFAYIECHGTGTKVGDRAELQSLNEFFQNRTIPIGSVKYNVGHTLIAAGGVSLMKGLGILKHRKVPPSPYFENFPGNVKTGLFLNKTPIDLKNESAPLNVGISSFGFGGTNFHMWLQEYAPKSANKTPSVARPNNEVVLCAESEASIEQVAELYSKTNYPIPPKSWPFVDKSQLLSVLLAEKTFRDNAIRPAELDLENVHVICGSAQPLEVTREIMERGIPVSAYRVLGKDFPQLKPDFDRALKEKNAEMIELNEQSSMGGINSLVASRVSKAFDFRGLNLTVDGDQAAGLQSLELARTLLGETEGAVLVFESKKDFIAGDDYLKTTGMHCWLIASRDFALKHGLPIRSFVQPMKVSRRGAAYA